MKNKQKLPNTFPPWGNEDLLKVKTLKSGLKLPGESTRKLVNNFGIYQLDLEIQNKGLLLIEGGDRNAYVHQVERYDSCPLGCLTLSKEGKIIEANQIVAELAGKTQSELINYQLESFVYNDYKPVFKLFLEKIRKTRAKETCDIILLNETGIPFHTHLTGVAIDGKEQYLITITDTTELISDSRALRLYRNMLMNISEGIFLIRASDQVIVYANPANEHIFGYAPHEMEGKKISTVNAPANKSPEAVAKEIIDELKKTGSWRGEIKNIKKDGTAFWCYANVSTFYDPLYGDIWVSIHMDITERKLAQEMLLQAEKKLQAEVNNRTRKFDKLNEVLKQELARRKVSQNQLKNTSRNYKNLYAYLQRVREEEQINIARIIHDDLAQLLTTLKIELTSFKAKINAGHVATSDSIDSMLYLTNKCLGSVTSIITELRPIVLDKMGFVPAVRQLLSNFQKRSDIICDTLLKGDSVVIKDEVATAIYRVIQEALTNILHHSKASHISVKISLNSSVILVTISDNGRGITSEEISDPKSFGIIGMKERIAGIQGRISFKGIPGKGTTVKLKVPIY